MRILFMDDDTEFRLIQAKLFRRDGHEVIEAATLTAAEAALESDGEDFDVAVLDMNMQPEEEGGLRIARSIHEGYSMIPSLVLTAFGATVNASRSMLEGVCAYVQKDNGTEDLALGLRYCYDQRVARIRHAIELALGNWWIKTVGIVLDRSRSPQTSELLPLAMQYFHVMVASMLCRPLPNHHTKIADLDNLLPLAGYHGATQLEYDHNLDNMTAVLIRSEVDSFPELQAVFRHFFGQSTDNTVVLSLERQHQNIVLAFNLGAGASPDSVVRFKEIVSGGVLESENDALLAMWTVQLTALRGLCRIQKKDNGDYHVRVTLPIEL